MSNVDVCVLKTDGINCDEEMRNAFSVVGADARIVNINELLEGSQSLDPFDVLAVPGGFSHGDDIASGKIFANALTSHFGDQLQAHLERAKPVIGICNGDQVLMQSGLLPNATIDKQQASLVHNDIGRFECRWIDMAVGKTVCKFVSPEDFAEQPIAMQTAHGEGRFVAPDEVIRQLETNGQIVFRYVNRDGSPANMQHPANPSGSTNDIAGVCDPTGTILGLMPHPERSVAAFHPDRDRTKAAKAAALAIFSNITAYAKSL